jgi:hypothetical protein
VPGTPVAMGELIHKANRIVNRGKLKRTPLARLRRHAPGRSEVPVTSIRAIPMTASPDEIPLIDASVAVTHTHQRRPGFAISLIDIHIATRRRRQADPG